MTRRPQLMLGLRLSLAPAWIIRRWRPWVIAAILTAFAASTVAFIAVAAGKPPDCGPHAAARVVTTAAAGPSVICERNP
jgi:hypothetical protein